MAKDCSANWAEPEAQEKEWLSQGLKCPCHRENEAIAYKEVATLGWKRAKWQYPRQAKQSEHASRHSQARGLVIPQHSVADAN